MGANTCVYDVSRNVETFYFRSIHKYDNKQQNIAIKEEFKCFFVINSPFLLSGLYFSRGLIILAFFVVIVVIGLYKKCHWSLAYRFQRFHNAQTPLSEGLPF